MTSAGVLVSGIGKRNHVLRLLADECAQRGVELIGGDASPLAPARVEIPRFEQLPFACEARFLFRRDYLVRGDDFQRNDAFAQQIPSAVHDAGAAAPHLSLHDEAVAQFPAFGDGRAGHGFDVSLVPLTVGVDSRGGMVAGRRYI